MHRRSILASVTALKSVWLALLLALMALSAGADSRLKGWAIQVCDDANEWPPYTYWERQGGQKTGKVTGYSVALLERLLQPLGMTYRIQLLPWNRCLQAVQEGRSFQLLLNATRNPQREVDFLITQPTYSTRTFYFWSKRTHPQGIAVASQSDLKRYRLGGVLGYTYSQLDEVDMTTLERAPNYSSLVHMLHLGRVDVIVVGEEVFHGLSGLPGYELAADRDLGRAPLPIKRPNAFHFLITRHHPLSEALHAALNAQLIAMAKSGELQALRAQHLRQ